MTFIFVAVVLPFVMWTLLFGVAGCGDGCDITSAWWTTLFILVLDGVVVAVVLPMHVLRAKRWKRTWYVPAIGIAALVLGAAIAYTVIRVAIPAP